MPSLQPVVVFERYDALTIFALEALPAEARSQAKAKWREQVKADRASLAYALQEWLESPLKDKPILLIIDDLERILEAPDKSTSITGIQEAFRPALTATPAAFGQAATQSRLLLTSRYDFTAFDDRGVDVAENLLRIGLTPMLQRERIKQWRAAERVAGKEFEAAKAEPVVLETAALTGAAWLERREGRTREALDLIRATFVACSTGHHAFGADFLRLGIECANRLGDAGLHEALLAAGEHRRHPLSPRRTG
jgi:hypothetical protein